MVKVPVDFPDQERFQKALENLFGIPLSKMCKSPEKKGEYYFTVAGRGDLKKALARDGIAVAGSSENMVVREYRKELSITEVFEFLHYKLQTRDRNENLHRNIGSERGERYKASPRD